MPKLTPRERLLRHLRTTARERFWSNHDRDSYACPVCDGGGPFEVHHRDGDPFNNHLMNLIGVCVTCHQREHGRRSRVESLNDWKAEFEAIAGGS